MIAMIEKRRRRLPRGGGLRVKSFADERQQQFFRLLLVASSAFAAEIDGRKEGSESLLVIINLPTCMRAYFLFPPLPPSPRVYMYLSNDMRFWYGTC